MALNVSQGNAVNVIAHYLGCGTHSLGGPPSHDDARRALVLLADGAHRSLMAGVGADHVRQAWRQGEPPPALMPTPPRAPRRSTKGVRS